ncbi:MAG: transcription repressor NadR [Lachnospiraceae bacterium]|nr:transcription repressor NadR [Lachnospiraceae bacterium]
MTGEKRRKEIINIISSAHRPISGTSLADLFQVSRQVIVQDIALLRAENKNIISTNRGYMLYQGSSNMNIYRRIFEVRHNGDQILDEFYTIVDLGGTIVNVSIDHELYGILEASLFISTRIEAQEFVKKASTSKDQPLSALTGDTHYHTIEAPSKEILNDIEAALKEKRFLVS